MELNCETDYSSTRALIQKSLEWYKEPLHWWVKGQHGRILLSTAGVIFWVMEAQRQSTSNTNCTSSQMSICWEFKQIRTSSLRPPESSTFTFGLQPTERQTPDRIAVSPPGGSNAYWNRSLVFPLVSFTTKNLKKWHVKIILKKNKTFSVSVPTLWVHVQLLKIKETDGGVVHKRFECWSPTIRF